MFYQKYERWPEALTAVKRLRQIRPLDPSFLMLEAEIKQQASRAQGPKK